MIEFYPSPLNVLYRIAGMTYPNGRALTYDCGVADGMNDAYSRIESVINTSDSLNLATYQFLGTSGFVNAASAQPGINWTLYGTTNDPNTGDIYSGLDRFGRVDNCLWKKGTTTLGQIQYGYDRASNRTWRKDGVLTGFDELYAYDGLYRLNDQKRGTLNGTQTAITSGTFEQQWGLDATGNWKTFKQDNDGNGTWELNQTRTANKANEITGITNSVGAAWATPTYDPAGNMIGIPNPQSLTAEYDAWNRLVSIKNGTTKISEHVYDARGYRIRKDTYTSGTLTEARHYYYTPGWQCVEERTGTLTTAERQFVWGLRYIDDLIMRDRSTANNGVINERRYAMQDGNWNTIAICDITGSVGERYAYSAYGTPVFMTSAGIVQASSAIGFETLYAGYRWDGSTPQMYYVRNRFLLPMVGTWNRRDPLGYVDGMGLYMAYAVLTGTDPFGLFEDPRLQLDPRNNPLLGGPGRHCAACHPVMPWPTTLLWCNGTLYDPKDGECKGGTIVPKTPWSPLICEVLARNCGRCSLEACKRDLAQLKQTITEVDIWVLAHTNTCQAWAEEYQRILLEKHLGRYTGHCFQIVIVVWDDPNGILSSRHAGIKIKRCDGVEFYIDNGALGGFDHLFYPNEIPEHWHENKEAK